jgi:hypothetical protein
VLTDRLEQKHLLNQNRLRGFAAGGASGGGREKGGAVRSFGHSIIGLEAANAVTVSTVLRFIFPSHACC